MQPSLCDAAAGPDQRRIAVGAELYVVGSAATYGIGYSDWVLRITQPQPLTGRANYEGVDVRPAEEALLENLRRGTLSKDLIAEPAEPELEAA